MPSTHNKSTERPARRVNAPVFEIQEILLTGNDLTLRSLWTSVLPSLNDRIERG
jgi:hypothetical protein